MAAQDRVELYSVLSQRVSEFAVTAVESTHSGVARSEQLIRLARYEAEVSQAFDELDTAQRAHFATVPQNPNDPTMRRATQSSRALTRLRTRFYELNEALTNPARPIDRVGLTVTLDNFAGAFSPMLNQQIAQDQQFRDVAFQGVDHLQSRLIQLAVGAAIITPLLLIAIYFLLIRPLLGRLGQASAVAGQITSDHEVRSLPVSRRDELGLLFARVNQMAARLDRRRRDVDADRARLTELVDERTADLRAANDRLSLVDAERRRFFADVGHELRTPLTVILAEAELAEGGDPDQSHAAMSIIRDRAKRLNSRIDDLLRIARSESGQIELSYSTISMQSVVEAAISDLAPLLKRSRCELTCDLQADLWIEADADWLRQVIGGVIENAIKYAGPDFQLVVKAVRDGPSVALRLADDGPGLAPEKQGVVFDRFTRGSQDGGTRGFGVGLALARWIVEEHGGSIRLVAPPENGRGTVVEIRLPLIDGEKETA